MKTLITLVGITVLLVGSASAQMNATSHGASKSARVRQDARIAHALNTGHTVYYIYSTPQTGSHIPQVVARSKNYTYTLNASGHGSAYGTTRDGLGGGPSSVGGALAIADPAITTKY